MYFIFDLDLNKLKCSLFINRHNLSLKSIKNKMFG